MKKKILAVLVCAALVLSTTACSGEERNYIDKSERSSKSKKSSKDDVSNSSETSQPFDDFTDSDTNSTILVDPDDFSLPIQSDGPATSVDQFKWIEKTTR